MALDEIALNKAGLIGLDVAFGEPKDPLSVFSKDVREILRNQEFLERLKAAQAALRETGKVDQSFVVWGERRKKIIWQIDFVGIDFSDVFNNLLQNNKEKRDEFAENVFSSSSFRNGRPIAAFVTLTSSEDTASLARDSVRHAELTSRTLVPKKNPFITVTLSDGKDEVDIEVATTKPFTKIERAKEEGKFYLISSFTDNTIVGSIPADRSAEEWWPRIYDVSSLTCKPSELAKTPQG